MAFTYFFRDRRALELVAEHVVPALRGQRYIPVWDAGCAHGPEPYSLAIMLREHMTRFLFRNVRIYCTDLDTCGLFAPSIRGGRFPEAELRRVPADLKARYFRPCGREGFLEVVDEVRSRIAFARHDLRSRTPIRGGLSLIVCKNVLLHLSAEDRLAAFRMFRDALREDGFLLVERTQPMPPECEELFERVTGDGQLFRTAARCSSLRAAA